MDQSLDISKTTRPTQTNNYADWLKSYTERDDLRNILKKNTFLVVVLSGSTGC